LAQSRDVRYARADDGAYIAYLTVGEGALDIAWQPGMYSNVDVIWQVPKNAAWFEGLASFSRLIIHDRRGTGTSSRNVKPPNLETRIADLRAVLDAVGSDRPVLGGMLEGGAASVLFAATMPERVHSLFWWYPAPRSTQAPDYPWGGTPEELDIRMRELAYWGTREFEDPDDPTYPWPLISRQSASPDVAAELEAIWRETDVRGAMPAVTAPALLMARDQDREALEYLAALMPRASVRLFPGAGDVLPSLDEQPNVLRAVREFIGVEQPAPELDTILATVLFTDIVGSTERQAAIGDRAWKELVGRHHAIVRQALERWRGVENDTAGDGFYATFDGPARAIRCAQEVVAAVRPLGIQVRAGVHTGECEIVDNKCSGLTVSIGSRVAAHAAPSHVLVSQTVKDLVAGSDLSFVEIGERELRGVPGRWVLYGVES
jgi:class 3 adenylate cyclase